MSSSGHELAEDQDLWTNCLLTQSCKGGSVACFEPCSFQPDFMMSSAGLCHAPWVELLPEICCTSLPRSLLGTKEDLTASFLLYFLPIGWS